MKLFQVLRITLALLVCGRVTLAASSWPGATWERISPSEAGLNEAKLLKARDYALSGEGSGYITRGGKLVVSWGDPAALYDLKSTTKSFGAAALGLAIKDGKIRLEDKAKQFHPEFGVPPVGDEKLMAVRDANLASDWLGQITILNLTSQTAGFEKPGGFTRLLFPPGAKWDYSDSGPNWLAECITLVYQMDLDELMFERIFTPLGIKRSDLRWRRNSYRPHEINGIARREFGAGIHANVDAMARFGLLFLRNGKWRETEILPANYIDTVRQPIRGQEELPVLNTKNYGNASAHYGLLWWNNGDGTLEGVPTDAYWSWGLFDSLIIVIPSMDIVVARAGKSWKRAADAKHYDPLKPFLQPIVASVSDSRAVNKPAASLPYPRSPLIRGVTWAPKDEIIRKARGSDNWPMTWMDDDSILTAYGDGNGFEPRLPEKLSLGLARLSGQPPNFEARNLRSNIEGKGDGARGRKASGLLMIDGVVYMWARNDNNARLARSNDRGQSWTWSDWRLSESFGCPTFLNFGKNYAGSRDDYVYIYSHDSDSAYTPADRMVLARVHRQQLWDLSAYHFFKGLDAKNQPVWTSEIAERGAVFVNKGKCYRSNITYNPGLKRYLWTQTLPGGDTRFEGGFAIFEGTEPWGPWRTVFYTEKWDVGPGESGVIPAKWISPDGAAFHMVFSGDDFFSVRKAELALDRYTPNESGKRNFKPQTRIAIKDGKWRLNDRITYPGARAEGLLMNVRMVNSTFEDLAKPDFDADANTAAFLGRLTDYAAHGVRAFTLCLQRGMPGYEGAINSAFLPDGSLRRSYLERVSRVIEACDRAGIAVILGCYYQRQDQILQDEASVRAGVVNAVRWLQDMGYRNVVLEIANEFDHSGFDYEILKSNRGQVELMNLARQTAPDLLVSTSGLGHGRLPDQVADASDFLLIHFNGTKLEDIPARIAALKKFAKPIVCNEDDKTGDVAARAAQLSVQNGASWGLMLNKLNQYVPFTFKGAADDPVVYSKLADLTGSGARPIK